MNNTAIESINNKNDKNPIRSMYDVIDRYAPEAPKRICKTHPIAFWGYGFPRCTYNKQGKDVCEELEVTE